MPGSPWRRLNPKAAVLILGGLLLVCVSGGAAFVFLGGAERALEITGGIAGMTEQAGEIERLNREFPFAPPADGTVPEDRLCDYIEVCRTIRPAVDGLAPRQGEGEPLLERTEGAVEARQVLLGRFAESLAAHSMSAGEFSWIHNTMQHAKGEAAMKADRMDEPPPAGTDEAHGERSADDGERRSRDPRGPLGPDVDPESITGPPSANARLYVRYAEALAACVWGQRGDAVLHGLGHSQGVRVTVPE